MEMNMEVHRKTKNSSCCTRILLYLKEYKLTHRRNTWTPIFFAALLTIVKLWKQPRAQQLING
jgi:hypothetical protein